MIRRAASEYLSQAQLLLPRGPFWSGWCEDAGTGKKLLGALAEEPARIDGRLFDLLREANPLTTSEMLSAREIEAGLPDECTPGVTTFFERRERLVAKWRGRGGQTPRYLVDLAASAGFDACILEPRPFRAGKSNAGHKLTNDAWRHWIRVGLPEETIKFTFRAGVGRAGEPLRNWGNSVIECLINKAKPAHVSAQFTFGDDVCGSIPGAVLTE